MQIVEFSCVGLELLKDISWLIKSLCSLGLEPVVAEDSTYRKPFVYVSLETLLKEVNCEMGQTLLVEGRHLEVVVGNRGLQRVCLDLARVTRFTQALSLKRL